MTRFTPDPVRRLTGLDDADLRALLGLVERDGLAELDLEYQGTRLLVRHTTSAPPAISRSDVAEVPPETEVVIRSPAVGRFRPSVAAGDELAVGDVIGSLETLGVQSQITAPNAGTVAELHTPGDSVGYADPLVTILVH
jgi:biotin carboxyl carrier protein